MLSTDAVNEYDLRDQREAMKALDEVRKERRILMRELSSLTGVAANSFIQWRACARSPSLSCLLRLVSAFGFELVMVRADGLEFNLKDQRAAMLALDEERRRQQMRPIDMEIKSGVSNTALHAWRSRQRSPMLCNAVAIAETFGFRIVMRRPGKIPPQGVPVNEINAAPALEALKTPGFWYLASPYSHPDPKVRADRAESVLFASGKLLTAGIHVYSPIHATHLVATTHGLPKDHLFWLAFNKAFIDPAVGIIVVGMDGWQQSAGCRQEIEYGHETGKPVYLLGDNGTIQRIAGTASATRG